MAKIELTLTINGVDQDIPVPDDEELTLKTIAEVSGEVTRALIRVLNEETAAREAETEPPTNQGG